MKPKPSPPTPPPSADDVRLRVQQLIQEAVAPVKAALQSEQKSKPANNNNNNASSSSSQQTELSAESLSRRLEDAYFKRYKSAGQDYRNRTRTVPFNLKNNQEVTKSLLTVLAWF
jgi:hypothetical protein